MDKDPETCETWGNFKEVCKAHNWPFWTLTRQKFPIEYDGWTIHKVPFRQIHDD